MALKPSFVLPPSGPLRQLVIEFQRHIVIPDPIVLYSTIATIIANKIDGPPVWLMIIGPSSGGKTLIIDTVCRIKDIHRISDLTGKAAFISGVAKKDRSKDATGGLLKRVGKFGIFVQKDFTSILSLRRDIIKEILTSFREISDGHWNRDVGSDGGSGFDWEGKIGYLAGVTYAIEEYHELMAMMGHRFIFLRMNKTDGEAEGLKAGQNTNPDLLRKKLSSAVLKFYLQIEPNIKHHPIRDWERQRILNLSAIAARARSPIVRDKFRPDQIVEYSEREMPSRFVGELTQLYHAMKCMKVPVNDIWRILGRMAIDSVPMLRRQMILGLADRYQQFRLSPADVRSHSNCNMTLDELMPLGGGVCQQTLRRRLEDLEVHGVVERTKHTRKNEADNYRLSEWMKTKWADAFPNGVKSALGEDL